MVVRLPPWLVSRKVCVLDLETTGHEFRTVTDENGFEERLFEPEHAHICQVAIIEIEDIGSSEGEVHCEWSQLVKPQGKLRNGRAVTVPKSATEVHGIEQRDVHDAPTFETLIPKIVEKLSGSIVVGYNARRFDSAVLNVELDRSAVGAPLLNPDRIVDVMLRVRGIDGWAAKGKGKGRLTEACKRWGVPVVDAHDALGDCRMTWLLFCAMAKKHPIAASTLNVYLEKQNAFAAEDQASFDAWKAKKKAEAVEAARQKEMF